LLEDAEQMATLFRQDAGMLRGSVRIDLISELANNLVIPRLPAFLRLHPGLEVSIGTADRFVDLAQEGVDCVLRLGELADSDLMVLPLGKIPMCNVASPEYLEVHGTPRELNDLKHHWLIHYSPNLSSRGAHWEWQDDEGQVRFRPMRHSLILNGTRSMNAACHASMGLMQVPRFGVRAHIESGQLVEVLPQHVGPPLPVSLLYPYRRHVPVRVRVTLDWLAATVAGALA
jgi:DNA-binding transcriptional LysR family regulator